MLQRMAQAGSPRGGAIAGDRLSSALRASLPPHPPFRQPSSVPPPRAAPELWAPGCATAGGARTKAQGECTALGPWGAYGLVWPGKVAVATTRVPLLGVPGPRLGAEKASDFARVVAWMLAPAGGGGAWNPQALSFLAAPLQVSLPEDGCPCRGCEPVCRVPIRESATRVCVYLMPPPRSVTEPQALCGSAFVPASLCTTEAAWQALDPAKSK